MDNASYIAQVAGLISFVGFIPYIIGILKKRVRPSLSTWIIWSVIGTILCVSYFETSPNIETSIWVPLSYAIGPIVICGLSFKYGIKELNYMDFICLFISLSSLLISYKVQIFYISLFLSIFADFLGAFPTLVKSYKEPESEDITAWSFFLVGNFINFFFTGNIYDYSSLYPLYLLFVSVIVFSFLVRGKIKKRLRIE